jgi:hypothetical protein
VSRWQQGHCCRTPAVKRSLCEITWSSYSTFLNWKIETITGTRRKIRERGLVAWHLLLNGDTELSREGAQSHKVSFARKIYPLQPKQGTPRLWRSGGETLLSRGVAYWMDASNCAPHLLSAELYVLNCIPGPDAWFRHRLSYTDNLQ